MKMKPKKPLLKLKQCRDCGFPCTDKDLVGDVCSLCAIERKKLTTK